MKKQGAGKETEIWNNMKKGVVGKWKRGKIIDGESKYSIYSQAKDYIKRK